MSKSRGDFGPNNQMWLGFYDDYTKKKKKNKKDKTKTVVQP